ncbi:MAG: hypothetical protein PHX03_05230, partial [Bacilli bacterium]|nr:hypothetical protein [Bacilli bacterium]
KLYLICDHQFYHQNIIKHVRTEFKDINEIHSYIIDKHNSVVTNDDIVIFLGDFSFKNNEIANINRKLNGIKFLILGNHDQENIIKNYQELGFEKTFMFPVKLNDYYLSHEPLAFNELSTLDYKMRSKEFNKNKDNINYHGHIHEGNETKIEDGYINVAAELIKYLPLYVTNTDNDEIKDHELINSDIFDDLVNETAKKYSSNKEHIIKDFLYASSLDIIKRYNNFSYIFGSYGFYKKYNYISNFSDLDIGILYNENISKKNNVKYLKNLSDEITILLNSFEKCEVEFFKRYESINIIFAHYADGKGLKFNTGIDVSCNPIAYDKPHDFINLKSNTLIEEAYPELKNEYHLPNYVGKYYSNNWELANLLIQLFFQKSFEQNKTQIIKKINYLINKKEPFILNTLEDDLIRCFIKNIHLLCSRSRYSEIEYIRYIKKDLLIYINVLKTEIKHFINYIIMDDNSEFNKNFNDIFSQYDQKSIPEVCKKLIKTRL